MKTMLLAVVAVATLGMGAGAAELSGAAAWSAGIQSATRLVAHMKASAARSFSGTGDVSGSANMFPCPIGPYGPTNGSTTGSAEVSGDISVASADGQAHGTIHVSGVVWLDAFCSEGFPGSSSGIGQVTGSGVVYGADGKPLGKVKVSGSAMVSGMGSGVSGTVTVKGSL